MNEYPMKHERHQFLRLVDELREALGYAIRNDEQSDGEELALEMMYGGFDFSIVHSQIRKPHTVLLECVFGMIPDSRSQSINLRLLEINAALAELDGSAFSIDRNAQSLIYTVRLELKHLDGTVLLRKMTETVWHGRRWLETRFMNSPDSNANQIVNPLQLA